MGLYLGGLYSEVFSATQIGGLIFGGGLYSEVYDISGTATNKQKLSTNEKKERLKVIIDGSLKQLSVVIRRITLSRQSIP